MTIHKALKHAQRQILAQQFDSMTEYKILKHWREYEPKRVEALIWKGMLRRTLIRMADDLLDMQIALEKREGLNPALARLEAWNRLMKHEEDQNEDADAPCYYSSP
jgi:hypothetical protein